jgi:hypothetical protein
MLYFVTVNNEAQSVSSDVEILAFCAHSPTLFDSIFQAERIADATIEYAKKNGYDEWPIVTSGYKIFKINAQEIEQEELS